MEEEDERSHRTGSAVRSTQYDKLYSPPIGGMLTKRSRAGANRRQYRDLHFPRRRVPVPTPYYFILPAPIWSSTFGPIIRRCSTRSARRVRARVTSGPTSSSTSQIIYRVYRVANTAAVSLSHGIVWQCEATLSVKCTMVLTVGVG